CELASTAQTEATHIELLTANRNIGAPIYDFMTERNSGDTNCLRELACALQIVWWRTRIRSCASRALPPGTSRLQIEIQTSHHRAFDAGAVLDVVNALRFASTRPTAGPSRIDDASARHVFGTYAMVGNLSITRRWLTRDGGRTAHPRIVEELIR